MANRWSPLWAAPMWASPCSLINWWAAVSPLWRTPPASPRTVCTPNVNGGDGLDINGHRRYRPGTTTEIHQSFMRKQAEIAIANATVIFSVRCEDRPDRCGPGRGQPAGRKPVILAVNKMDQVGMTNPDIYGLQLGAGGPHRCLRRPPRHRDLLDACFAHSPEEEERRTPDLIKVAVIRQANVENPPLINRILGEERVIVSSPAPPGTRWTAILKMRWASSSSSTPPACGKRPR